MPITTLEPTSSQKRLTTFSAISAVLAVLQLVLAGIFLSVHNETLVHIHEGLGFLYALMAIVTVFPAWVWGRLSRSMGLLYHAIGMAVLGVVQLLMGLFMHGGAVVMVHMALGVLIVIGALGLFTMARRRPTVVTNLDGTARGGVRRDG